MSTFATNTSTTCAHEATTTDAPAPKAAKTTPTMTILDGGMGHLLRRNGVEVKGPIGSVERFLGVALANLDKPEIVTAAHDAYLAAGARVIITNSYACIPGVVGDDRARVDACVTAAGELARAVAAKYDGALVAGSLPPLRASYRPDQVLEDDVLDAEYKHIAATIAPFCDILICETMSCVREAAAAARAGAATGLPVWVSWSLQEDDRGALLSGESVEDAVAALVKAGLLESPPADGDDAPAAAAATGGGGGFAVEACLFNCSAPEAIDVALPRLRACTSARVRLGAYANGFVTVRSPPPLEEPAKDQDDETEEKPGAGWAKKNAPVSEYRADLTPEAYAACAARWATAAGGGASLIGGCCGVFPEHIDELAKQLLL